MFFILDEEKRAFEIQDADQGVTDAILDGIESVRLSDKVNSSSSSSDNSSEEEKSYSLSKRMVEQFIEKVGLKEDFEDR
jgi:hypothetical protein